MRATVAASSVVSTTGRLTGRSTGVSSSWLFALALVLVLGLGSLPWAFKGRVVGST